MKNATISPSKTSDFIFTDINLSVKEGSFTVVIGPVRVGKTTLLKAIIGEIECDAGTITVCYERIAYCSQSPWLINGSIKEAINGFGK